MSQERKLNVAIVGTSPISLQVASDLEKAKRVELVAIVSRDKNKALKVAELNKIKEGFDIPEALINPKIDLVYIGVPTKVHAEIAIQFLQAGKHVIIEKPMASTKNEVQRIINVAKENNCFCMEALMYQCHPFIEYLVSIVNLQWAKIKNINATYIADIYHLENKVQGGAIRNLGCYPVSLVRLLAKSEPISLKNCSGKIDELGERDQFAKITLEFKNGLIADITTSTIGNMYWNLSVEGDNGWKIQLETNPWLPGDLNKFNIINSEGQTVRTFEFKGEQPLYSYQFDYAAEQILTGKISPERPGVTWEHSLGNAAILEYWLSEVMKVHKF